MLGIGTAIGIAAGAGGLTALGTYMAGESSKAGAETMSKGAIKSAEIQAQSQREQLEYLKEINALPTELRNQALTQLGGLSGMGDANTQQEILDRAKASPFYKEMLAEGQESVMSHAAMTGGFRSGDLQTSLYDEGRKTLQSAYESELSNLRGLAGLPTGQENISRIMGNIGATEAGGVYNAAQATSQGQIAQGQIYQQGLQGIGNIGMRTLGMMI